MTRDQAYEIACQQGFEGEVFFSEQDAGVGKIQHVRMTIEDPDTGESSLWHAEVSEVNGSEMFSEWNSESEAFYREQLAAQKKTRRRKSSR